MNTWTYQENPITEIEKAVIGFIYVITHIKSGKKYYGKKQTTFSKTSLKTVTLKSGIKKKKKIKSKVESDWKIYHGSSESLQKDIDLYGKESFSREILTFCYSLSQLSYQEARVQFVTDCLLQPDLYYNNWLSVRVRRDHLLKTPTKSCDTIDL